jgi:multiple sugar transport system substrate-binding protein
MDDTNTTSNLPQNPSINKEPLVKNSNPNSRGQVPLAQEAAAPEGLVQPVQAEKKEQPPVSSPPSVAGQTNVFEQKPSQPTPPAIVGAVPTAKPMQKDFPASTIPPAPKRKFPIKKILIGLAILIFLLVAFVLARSFLSNKKTTKQVTLTWWGLWEDASVYKSLIDQYQSQNPDVKINYLKQSPQDYRERLTNALAKGTAPDIFTFHNSWTVMFAKELDNVPASFASAADIAQDYYPVVTSDLTYGAGIVGIPLGYDALTLFINEDMFSQAGLNPPTTWVELRDDAKLLTKTENGVITQAGVALGRTENVDHWPEIVGLMMLQNGVSMSKPQGKLAEDALVFYTLFSRTDGVWNETLPPSTSAFAGGKLAMYFGPSWRYFNIKEQNPDLNFRTVSLPQLPKEDPNEPNISYATYWACGVWARSANKDKAWDFLKFVSSKDSLQKEFAQASASRGFGEAYPRVDMANSLLEHPILGSVIKLAPEAQSWFLADRTFDGATGINSQIKKYFEDAINAVNQGTTVQDALKPLTLGVQQVLGQYGLVKQ